MYRRPSSPTWPNACGGRGFPNEIAGIGWQQGIALDYLREIVRYWLDAYDWRVHEARLNRYEQFITTVDGQRIHFLHIRSRQPDAIPLFLTHGWPGSVVEFLDVIEPLADPADPADAFHLVVAVAARLRVLRPDRPRAGWNPRRSPPPSGRSPTASATSATASRAATGARSSPATWPSCARSAPRPARRT